MNQELDLQAVTPKAKMDDSLHVGCNGLGTAKLTNPLRGFPHGKVTRTRFAMLGFPVCSQTKPLFGTLVSFLLWHFN